MFIQSITEHVVPDGVNGLHRSQLGQPDHLLIFGFIATCFAVFFFFFQHRSRSCTVVLAVCLVATAIYALLQGAWPLAFIQVAWAMKVIQKAWHAQSASRSRPRSVYLPPQRYDIESADYLMNEESRVGRLFGRN